MESARASAWRRASPAATCTDARRWPGTASTHAWAEVYLPTLGWRGLDPTIGGATATNHIVTGVSTHPRGVMPVSGTFTGASGDYLGLQVTVKTTVLDGDNGRSCRSPAGRR